MGSLDEVISAFELFAGVDASRIESLIVFALGGIFVIWSVFQLSGYYRAWASGGSKFIDMALYFVRTTVLLVLVMAYLLV